MRACATIVVAPRVTFIGMLLPYAANYRWRILVYAVAKLLGLFEEYSAAMQFESMFASDHFY